MYEKVYLVVVQIPKGKVMTYSQVAQKAGINNPRLVGKILHENPSPKTIPCHRVIRSDGTVASGYAFGGKLMQRKLLENEGVVFRGNKIINITE